MAASLAKQLRAVQEHDDEERYDLANYTQLQAHDLVKLAFSEPLEAATEPLRFTFIVGGGKLVRHKYSDDLPKWLAAELRSIGYEEDKGAALGSEGAWKFQHDTGQNLFYTHVFPKRVPKAAGGEAQEAGQETEGAASSAATSVLSTPLGRCLTCAQPEFEAAVAGKVAPWSHKRRLLAALQAWQDKLSAYEGKMVARQALTDAEQAEYDITDGPSLAGKVAWLQGEMKGQVAAARLTAAERDTIGKEMGEKADQMKAAKAEAEAAGQAKKAAAAATQLEQLEQRRAALAAKCKETPAASYPIKAQAVAEIRKLRNQLSALDKLERANAGKMLSVSERVAVERQLDTRPELQERLDAFVTEARGWFESAEEWEGRVKEAMGGGGPAWGGAGGGRR